MRCGDRQGRQEWWRTGDSSPHTRPSPGGWAQPTPRTGFPLKQTLDGTSSDGCIQTLMWTQACKQCAKVSKHPATYKHSPSEDILSKGCVYCRINHQLFLYIIHVLSRPLCTRGRLAFFFTSHSLWLSYPDHALIQTPVTIQLNPQLLLLQRILLVNCWECGNEAISGIWAS